MELAESCPASGFDMAVFHPEVPILEVPLEVLYGTSDADCHGPRQY